MADEQHDAALLRAALSDRDAFGAFYRLHALAIYRWFRHRVTRDHATASELTAETFAEALRSLGRFRGNAPGDGVAWVFGIARNLAREHHRTRRVRATARRELHMPLDGYVDDAFDIVETRIDDAALREEIARALAELPAAQREAIWLKIVAELEYPVIADATGSSEQAVRLRVFRGLRSLRVRLAAPTREEC